MIDNYNPEQRRYYSEKHGCELVLPDMPGWQSEALDNAPSDDFLFQANSSRKLLYIFLAAESLDTELEDYFLLLKVSNKTEQMPGYRFIGKSTQKIHDDSCLIFTYSAKFQSDDIGIQDFTYTNALFRKNGYNFRLSVYTLSEAYERKRETINEIIRGFRFVTPSRN